MTRGDPAADREQAHLLIRRYPESGVDALFVNPIYTTRLADRDEAVSAISRPSLPYATQPGFVAAGGAACGRRAIWDNRTTPGNGYRWLSSLLYRTTPWDPPNTG